MSDLFDATLQAVQKGLDVYSRRQAVLTSNVANLDTPHYTPKDLDFAEYLSRVTQAAEPSPIASTASGHLEGSEQLTPEEDVRLEEHPDRAAGPDGNSVDLDRQLALAARNAHQYAALSRVAQQKLAVLKYVTSNS